MQSKKKTPASAEKKPKASMTSALKQSEDRTEKEMDTDMSSMESNAPTESVSAVNHPQTAISPALKELFLDEIKDIYWAEKQLVKVLPKMQQAAASEELADALGNHLEETKTHVERLEQIFAILDEKPLAKKCDAMEGITKEGESIVEETEEGTPTRDAGVIMASQKVEHYEIATYGSLKQIASTLQMQDVADLLDQTLTEEIAADEKLTQVAAGLHFTEAE